MLASFLKTKILLASGTKVTAYRNRKSELRNLFTNNEEKSFAYCNDIEKLMKSIEITYVTDDWRCKNANVIRDALVSLEKISLPLLHVKLAIFKNFLKAVAKRDEVFRCLCQIFPKISPAQ